MYFHILIKVWGNYEFDFWCQSALNTYINGTPPHNSPSKWLQRKISLHATDDIPPHSRMVSLHITTHPLHYSISLNVNTGISLNYRALSTLLQNIPPFHCWYPSTLLQNSLHITSHTLLNATKVPPYYFEPRVRGYLVYLEYWERAAQMGLLFCDNGITMGFDFSKTSLDKGIDFVRGLLVRIKTKG